jgi:membrane protein implicated in regulation of membrane protease activity
VEESGAGQRFAGGCLLAVGLLIATLCGACTLLLAGGILVSVFGSSSGAQVSMLLPSLMIPLIIGGIPTAIGVTLTVIGWRMLRRPKPPSPPENIFS